jgi:hypothetical protein
MGWALKLMYIKLPMYLFLYLALDLMNLIRANSLLRPLEEVGWALKISTFLVPTSLIAISGPTPSNGPCNGCFFYQNHFYVPRGTLIVITPVITHNWILRPSRHPPSFPTSISWNVTQTVNTVRFDLPPYWSPSFSMVNLEYSWRCWIERKLGELPAVYPMQWRIYSAARHNRYSYPGLCSPYSFCTSLRP